VVGARALLAGRGERARHGFAGAPA
jgi:hypothetical protein